MLLRDISGMLYYILFLQLFAMGLILACGSVGSAIYPSALVVYDVIYASYVGFFRVFFRPWFVITIMTVLLLPTIEARHLMAPVIPPSGSSAHKWAEFSAIMLLNGWIDIGIVQSSGVRLASFGTIPTIHRDPELSRIYIGHLLRIFFLAFPVAAIALYRPGPWIIFGILGALASNFLTEYLFLCSLARFRRNRAPLATDQSLTGEASSAYLLQLSDVHLTSPGSHRVEGGAGGNENLEYLSVHLKEKLAPKVLMITGDLVDTGAEDQWQVAMATLFKLRERGTRILLGPGNHDLGTAYEPGSSPYFLFWSRGTQRRVDTRKFMAYLHHAALLEPQLRCYNGGNLTAVVQEEVAKLDELLNLWSETVRSAIAQLQGLSQHPFYKRYVSRSLKEGETRALRMLLKLDPAAAEVLLHPLFQKAAEYFGPASHGTLEDYQEFLLGLFTKSRYCIIPPLMLTARWQPLWTDVFPLKLYEESDSIEFLIVNSVLPEPGLVGSALGKLGKKQLERLRDSIAQTRAKIVVILMHNPICRWRDDSKDYPDSTKVDVQRWALLAHDLGESECLPQLLDSAAPGTCAQILLCCGHRHGLSRAGPPISRESNSDLAQATRLFVLESAALTNMSVTSEREARTNELLACRQDPRGYLTPFRVDLKSVTYR